MSGFSSSHSKLGDRIVLGLVVLLSLVMLLPILWVIGLSLKENSVLMADPNSVFHPPYIIGNYINILQTSSVFRWILNSLIVSISLTIGTLILSSLAGYGFARLNFPGRDVLFVIVLFGLAVPEQAVLVARHQIFSMLSLHNTYPGLVLPGLSSAFGVFLMTQYFRAIPRDLDEAALLDNASRFRIFWKVLLPLTLPAQATLGIFTFLASWNDYFWPLISASRKDMYTLTVGLASTQTNFGQSEGLGFLMAQAVFAGAPILIIYLFFQKYIVTAVSGAAVR
ncbi:MULTISPECIES: carbohydrate ABC transporter permease [Rhizobium/Agrobacterium group]|uniref:sn-glycerol-3-phosphate transport system permease protein UgpE n=2 Tax=Rhizobium/Agrobacterium group TaxID=227290 RepID=B9K1P1_ALLAM|nr:MULTISPECIES: carbohydrate ABC transporter permease [Rhizobium/Agrobacterium group]ACM38789.1 ABC transporter membrane spanning protein (sugar) [Allorhizobium ampelinum S4]MCF1445957.1 carbohydrate ABC transporter permease [Allorhizobium ampelinum]MCF1491051.1 carbohydrate ABC transporter permease [Allorhizobium ampelinum]MUO26511.1 ABC transporter permease subunit [Agrobacterium vitis]MUO41624.1 ABC transporter permease subunit [Agrobacterium vitis]